MRINSRTKYKKTLSFFISKKAYLGKDFCGLNKSLYPFILGKRDKNSYYDLNVSLMGIKNSLEILEGIIARQGIVFSVGGDLVINSVLLYLSNLPQSNILVMSWDFSRITKISHFDILLLHEVTSISQLESYNKMRPYIGINSLTAEDLSYLFNLNLHNAIVLNWYLYVLVYSYRKGLYSRVKRKRNEI